jgi:hypothetical protein
MRMRRLPVALAALLTLSLAAAVAVVALPRAEAQQATVDVVFVDNLGVDPSASGAVDLAFDPAGANAMFAQCGGAFPSGPQAPFQITTRQPTPFHLRLTIRNSTAGVVSAPVRVNCTFDFVVPESTSAATIRQAVQRVAARQVALGQ